MENHFCQIKDRIKITNSKYNIYETPRSDSGQISYIGESTQILQKRIQQHTKSIADNKNGAALTDNAIRIKHNFNFNDVKSFRNEIT